MPISAPNNDGGGNAPRVGALAVVPRAAALDGTLSRSALRLVIELGAHNGLDGWAPVRVTEIAAILGVSRSTGYRGLRQLVRRRYVLRRLVTTGDDLRTWPRATYVYRVNLLAEAEGKAEGVGDTDPHGVHGAAKNTV